MIVEILGISPQNQGARLMLEAICSRLRIEFKDVKIAVPITFPYSMRMPLGLWATPTHERPKFDLAPLAERLPSKINEMLGLIPSSKVDVVLDASGFSYGDYWGVRTIKRRITRYMKKWKRPGKTLILLPQAFGPFENSGMAKAFSEALSFADLVYARDSKSFQFVRPLVAAERLKAAHDFTNLIHPQLPARLADFAGVSYIIPNYRVVKGRGAERHRAYLDFLSLAARKLMASGRRVMILVHEGTEDRALGEDLNAATGLGLPLVYETDVMMTKALIANAELIVSSRFHGLVSALCNGVPALACGWSHKYLELMSDYGCGKHVIDVNKNDTWDSQFADFLADVTNATFLGQLKEAAAREIAASEEMWHEVFATIRSR